MENESVQALSPERDLYTLPAKRLARSEAQPQKGGELERLEHLRTTMVRSINDGVNSALAQWVSRYHGEPQSLDMQCLRAIVRDFDTFLMQPGVEDTQFTRSMIQLRNVFARHANMMAPATVSLDPRPSPMFPPLTTAAPAPEHMRRP